MGISDSDKHDEFYNTKTGYKNYQFNDDDVYEDYQPGEIDDNIVVLDTPPLLIRMLEELKANLDREALDLDQSAYSHMVSSMMVAVHVSVRMTKEYFEIEASKATPQYGFRKRLKLFGDKGYQATKDELKVSLFARGCINMLSSKNLTWNIRKQALGYFVFLKRKESGKMKARGCADRRHQQEYISKEESSSPTVSLYTLMGSYLLEQQTKRK